MTALVNPLPTKGPTGPRDVLFVNCSVITMQPVTMQPHVRSASAVALRGDRVLAVGNEEELRPRLAPGAQIVDGQGGCLLPAFHDCHVHLTQHGFELSQLNLHSAANLDEGLRRVAAHAVNVPAGSWILGAGFGLQRWGLQKVDRGMLDRVVPDHPVLLRSQDHHSAWVNSLALQRAGVSSATPSPPDGTVVRDRRGEATGLLLERALHLVWDKIPAPHSSEIAQAVARAGDDLASRGIATVHHMAYEPAAYWREVAQAASRDEFPLRVWACVNQEDIEHASAVGIASGQGGGNFAIGGAKFFADGALGSRTAWMLEPYLGGSERGVAVHGPEVLAERYPLAIEAGLTPVTHAIGDAAARAVLDALEATAPQWRGKGMRPRLEHAQHLAADDVARLARLGVIASMQPIHLTFDVPSVEALLGDRKDRAYRIRSLLDAGVPLAFGSDTPVAPPDVFEGLRAACRRIGVEGNVLCPQQAISVQQALHAYTGGAAYAIGRDGRSGRLVSGFDADLVLLSHNPLESLDELNVLATIKGGQPTYDPAGLVSAGYTRS
ncbi:MAG: amidohydrolase [Trueperaceae bacterium]